MLIKEFTVHILQLSFDLLFYLMLEFLTVLLAHCLPHLFGFLPINPLILLLGDQVLGKGIGANTKEPQGC